MGETKDSADQLDELLDVMDQPSIDAVNSNFVCRAALETGLNDFADA